MATEMPFTDFAFEEDRLKEMVSGQTHKLDAQLHVQFYKRGVLNSFESEKQGRKIFEEKLYVRILMPANRLNEIDREATEVDRARFARQFASFVERGESLQTGTPLDQLPGLTSAQVLEFKHLKVDTVEQLAGVADTVVNLLGTGGQTLKQKAIRFLDERSSSVQLSEEVRALRRELAELQEKAKAVELAKIEVKTTTAVKG
jgi:hypothetical protein